MNHLAILPASVAAVVYQLLAAPLYRIGDTVPSFVLPVFLYFAFFQPASEVILFALFIAIPLDLVSLAPFGTNAVSLAVTLFFVSRLQGWFVLSSATLRVAVVLPAVALDAVLRSAWVAALEPTATFRFSTLAVVYTAGVALALHGILDAYRGPLGWSRDRRMA